jgi:hypothetical protein
MGLQHARKRAMTSTSATGHHFMPYRLNPEDIDGAYSSETGGRGLVLHHDGSVAEIGFYRGGAPTGWVLHLPLDSEPYLQKKLELGHDPDVELETQVKDWIAKIERSGLAEGRVCSFCEKDQSEVATLIAGPESYICNECITMAAEILASRS